MPLQSIRRRLYDIGLLPIFGNKGYGLTWPGPLHRRLAIKLGEALITAGKKFGARSLTRIEFEWCPTHGHWYPEPDGCRECKDHRGV